jgi:hypothetical protein
MVILASLAMVLHCSHPGGREIDGKVKGKASLRLADGSTISQPNSDEYRPQIVTLSNGYLVLAFGSNRACNNNCSPNHHNIFLAKSLTQYDGTELPFFAPPVVFNDGNSPINDPYPINFAVVASGSNAVDVYFNSYFNSNSIYQATFDFSVNYGYPGLIDNSTCQQCKVIGANAAGNRLVVLDQQQQGMAFIIDPGGGVTDIPYGFWLANANSAMQVRQEVSGFDDAYIAINDGSSLATTGSSPRRPIASFNRSVSGSGFRLTSIGAFYSNNPSGDWVLFSANDGQSDDMYIVTSHTAGELWRLR